VPSEPLPSPLNPYSFEPKVVGGRNATSVQRQEDLNKHCRDRADAKSRAKIDRRLSKAQKAIAHSSEPEGGGLRELSELIRSTVSANRSWLDDCGEEVTEAVIEAVTLAHRGAMSHSDARVVIKEMRREATRRLAGDARDYSRVCFSEGAPLSGGW
jgi:hypothetical protein